VVMYVIYIVLFCRYDNHAFVSRFARNNHGVEYELPPTICTPSIFDKRFSFVEKRIGPTGCQGIQFSCCIITELKNLNLTKLQSQEN
jgi:hypothetical protein